MVWFVAFTLGIASAAGCDDQSSSTPANSGSSGKDAGSDATSSATTANDGGTDSHSANQDPYKPALLADLGTKCNTPDGMRLQKSTGNVILACPNFFEKQADGTLTAMPALMKITADNKVEPWFSDLPAPVAGPARIANSPLVAGPMGIDFGPDNNLYVCDHQYRYDTTYKSRILRIKVDATGNPTGAEVVVEGLRLANALMWNGDNLFVTDTWAYDTPATGGKSAVYRFTKTELTAASTATPIKVAAPNDTVTPPTADPHMFTTLTTVAGRGVNMAGADGLTFDDEGNLYVGKFGDGIINKITFNADGTLKDNKEFANDPKMNCADGIFFDSVSKNIYVADSRDNAIRVVSPAGVVSTLWENDETDGTGGLLDQPAEPTIRGGDLIIANFDSGFSAAQKAKNSKSDAPHTLSVIKLR